MTTWPGLIRRERIHAHALPNSFSVAVERTGVTRHPIPAALALLTLAAAVATIADALPAGPVALAVSAAWGLGALLTRMMR